MDKKRLQKISRIQIYGVKFILIFCMIIIPQVYAGADWIQENIELTINGNFESAINLLNDRMQKNPNDYRTYFYLAATLNSKMTHFENSKDEFEFNNFIDKTIQLIEPKLENKAIDDTLRSKLLFYLGSAYGYLGYFEGKKGNWYSAVSNGLKAKSLLSESIEIDSTIVEAYVGIGVYKYWLSSKIGFIIWIPFVPDDREEGIEMIKKSIKNERPGKYIAMHQLVYILIDYGRFEEAIVYAEKIVKRYPQSQFMWWANAHTYYKMRNYEKAIFSYNRLLTLFKNDSNHNPGHFIKCNLKLAQLYFELEDFTQCIRFCRIILKEKNSTGLYEKYSKEFGDTEEYLLLSEEQLEDISRDDED